MPVTSAQRQHVKPAVPGSCICSTTEAARNRYLGSQCPRANVVKAKVAIRKPHERLGQRHGRQIRLRRGLLATDARRSRTAPRPPTATKSSSYLEDLCDLRLCEVGAHAHVFGPHAWTGWVRAVAGVG